MTVRPSRAAAVLGLTLAAAVSASACGGSGPIDPALPLPEPSIAPGPGADLSAVPGLRMLLVPQGLDEGPLSEGALVPDISGLNRDAVVALPEGDSPELMVESDSDLARQVLDFPAPCGDEDPCLRPILEVADARSLNPGTRDFRVIATVRLDDSETATGSNIIQKGFSTGGSGQWKLQVDGEEGIPTCAVVQPGDDTIHLVEGSASLADGQWHDVECQREDQRLTIFIDGEEQASIEIPDGIDLTTEFPIRVGGKNLDANNDPFHGDIAQVALIVR